MLGAAGVAGGLVLAVVMRGLLARLLPADQRIDLRMDAEVFAASVLTGLAAAVFLAIVTAWQGNRRSVAGVIGALKDDQPSARLWLRKGLIAGQLALSVIVLVAAALLGQTLRNLHLVDPGFERAGVLIASFDPGGRKPDAQAAFYRTLLDEVRATPGVMSAALAGQTPLDVNTWWGLRVSTPTPAGTGGSGATGGSSGTGVSAGTAAEATNVPVAFVAPGYFATIGMPFVRGRDLDPREQGGGSTTVVVNQAFATRLLGRDDVIGATVSGNGNMLFTIVGVVRDSAALGLRESHEPVMYVPLGREPRGQLALHVRAAVPPATLVVRLVLREAVLLVAIGLVLGISLASALAGTLESVLFGVQPGDWKSVASAVGVLLMVAVLSAWLPARRAAGVDPLIALRHD